MSKKQSIMSSVINYFLPEEFDENQKVVAKRLIGVSLVQIVAGYIYAPIYFLLGHHRGAVAIMFCVVIVTLNPFLIKFSKNLKYTRHIPASLMFLTLVFLAYTQDGLGSTSLPWFTTVGVIALVSCGIRNAIF